MKNFTFKRPCTLLVTVMACVTSYAYDFQVDGIYYEKDGANARVVAGDNKYEGVVTIPAKVDYAGASYWVETIANYAFDGCDHVTKVVLSDEIKYINYCAFRNCTGLSDINLGDNIVFMGGGAFYNCTSLTSVVLGKRLATMEGSVFENCTGITTVKVHDGAAYIGDAAFKNCSKLTSLDLPASVKYIGGDAFCGCVSMTTANIGNGVETIGNYAFDGCNHLTKVVLGNDVKNINYCAFRNCTALSDINLGDYIVFLAGGAFYNCTSLTSVVLGKRLATMEGSVFENCTGITSIKVHDGAAYIGDAAFKNCTRLTGIELPNSISYLGGDAFCGCKGLVTFKAGNGLETIGNYAFDGCNHLQDVIIGSDLRRVNYCSFRGCTAMKTLTILTANVPDADNYSFDNFNVALIVPSQSVSAYKQHGVWGKFSSVTAYTIPVYLSIRQAEGGVVKHAVNVGERYTYLIELDNEWKVNTVTFNGEDVTEQLIDNAYTTPALTSSSILRVSYESTNTAMVAPFASSMKVYGQSGTIVVKGATVGDVLYIYGVDGILEKTVIADSDELRINVQGGQTYIVKTAEKAFKLAL